MELKRIRERREEKKSTSFFSVSCTSADGRKSGKAMYGEGECNKREGGVYEDEGEDISEEKESNGSSELGVLVVIQLVHTYCCPPHPKYGLLTLFA